MSADFTNDIEAGSRWLQNYLDKSGQDRFVIGLSGGVDSATVAYWAVKAVGPERVSLISMPYGVLGPRHFEPSDYASVDNAWLVAQKLPGSVKFRQVDIGPTVDTEAESVGLLTLMEQYPERDDLEICLANIKARIRAVRLRYFANINEGLVLGTENRSEYWLGYFTLGGDEESDVEVLSDFYKTEVWSIAEELGVPEDIRERPPSADLWKGQTDEGELGFRYRDADPVIAALVGEASDSILDRADSGLVEKVMDRMKRTAFKRQDKPCFERQSPSTFHSTL